METTDIEDAQYALYVYPALSVSDPVPLVQLAHNDFTNNFVGIYTPPSTGGKIEHIIVKNTFKQIGILKAPFSHQTSEVESLPEQKDHALAAMYINDIKALSLTKNNCYFLTSGITGKNTTMTISGGAYQEMKLNTAFYPDFTSAGKAVVTTSGGARQLIVQNIDVRDCEDTGIEAGFMKLEAYDNKIRNTPKGIFASLANVGGITIGKSGFGNKITNAQTGIFVAHADPNGSVAIDDNEVMTNSDDGGAGIVLIFGNANTNVLDNAVEVNGKGRGILLLGQSNAELIENTIQMNNTDGVRSGIYLGSSEHNLLSENYIFGSGIDGEENIGIEIFSSPDVTYCCNTVDNTKIGVQFDDGCLNTDGLKGTIFANHDVGLQLKANAVLGIQTHQENLWGGSYISGHGAIHEAVSIDFVELSGFVVDNSINSSFYPLNPVPFTDWFISQSNGSNIDICSTPACQLDEDFNPETPDIIKIIRGETNGGEYPDALQWLLENHVYSKVYDMNVSGEVGDFKLAKSQGSVGKFYAVSSAIKQGFIAGNVSIATMQSNLTDASTSLGKMIEKDYEWLNASESNQSALLISKNSIMQDAVGFLESNDALWPAIVNNRVNTAVGTFAVNENILTTQPFEQNRKDFNANYLNFIQYEMQGLKKTELTALKDIANQCPLEGGRAVMDARAMLMTVYGKVLEYDDECEIKKPKALGSGSDNEDMISSNHFEKNGLLKIAPNPATDQISVSWSGLQETVQSLTIASMLGQKLITLDNVNTVDYTVLDISHIKAGVYFIILQTENGEKLSRKVIINR